MRALHNSNNLEFSSKMGRCPIPCKGLSPFDPIFFVVSDEKIKVFVHFFQKVVGLGNAQGLKK